MPWPMVHFAVSNQLHSGKPTPQLLLGSIAPDALHARGQTTREEKGLTHLVQNDRLASAALIMKTLQQYIDQHPEREWTDFIVGYFTHIYTDARWTHGLYEQFSSNYSGEDRRYAYHQEAAQIEFELQRSLRLQDGDDPVRLLLQAKAYAVEPFVTEMEVNRYREMKIEWLNDPRNEPHIAPDYFTVEQVDQFVQATASEIQELFRKYGLEHLL
ncbi:hypothetical protein [Paenibacillus wulumuqiensis]|uniref:hypothetical protein n=1 Tax=Paenibacillus wulumuqiensis TaxID=1567107 RepID=UPI000619C6AF|nr:hypothetical protein [Paenibacillus wulumuqiensis]